MSKINEKVKMWIENDNDASWAVSNLYGAYTSAYYGKITVQFEAGRIVLLRKEQTQKPPKILKRGE